MRPYVCKSQPLPKRFKTNPVTIRKKWKNPPGGGTGRVIMIGAGDRGGQGAPTGGSKFGGREALRSLVAGLPKRFKPNPIQNREKEKTRPVGEPGGSL